MKVRKILPVMLLLLLMIAILPFQAAASEDIIASGLHDFGPIEWKITSDGTLTISGNRSMQAKTEYLWDSYADVVTKIVVEDGITTIAENAFVQMKNITQVYIGNTVTEIGENAFLDCAQLTSVSIPASMTKIGRYAFGGCSSLSEITFHPQTTALVIGERAFSNTSVTALSFPSGVKEIGTEAFSGCEALTTVSFTEGLEKIGHDVFWECYALGGDLYLPATLTDVGTGFFGYHTGWTSVDMNCSLGNIFSFQNNAKLKTVAIHSQATVLPNYAFENCTQLESITIDAPITQIGWSVFEGCTSLKEITLPDTVQQIGNSAFKNSAIEKITLPDAVTEIDMSCFEGCKELTSVKIGSGLKKIENFTFENCTKLKEIDLAGVQVIGSTVFSDCGLESIEIPETVRLIESCAFADISTMKTITFLGNAPTFGTNKDSFKNTTATAYYNPDTAGWTEAVMQDYGGTITWVSQKHTHDFKDGICTVCGVAEKFDLYGTNMTLGNSLSMNFFIEVADLDADESYYAIITKAYANGADKDFRVDQADWGTMTINNVPLRFAALDVVAAKEMTDDVKVVIYNSKNEAVSNVYTDSVRAYTMRAMSKEESGNRNMAKLAMYVDMLNYGAAAQQRFNYNVSDLANNQLSAAQKGYATSMDDVTMADKHQAGEGYVGTNLTLESNLLMNFFFNNIPDKHNDMYAIATFTNHYGEPVEVRIEGEEFGQLNNDTKWYVPVKGVVIADCSQLVTVKVYNANDTVVASGVDSIESYIARAIDRDPQLYNAIMKFAVSAREALRRN